MRAPAHARASLDHAIHTAFAHGLDVTLLVAGGAGLTAAAIVIGSLPGTVAAPSESPQGALTEA
jgi:hypothetical protein